MSFYSTHDTFCRNPLHPGPCKGWKGARAATPKSSKVKKASPPPPPPSGRERLAKSVETGVAKSSPLSGGAMASVAVVTFGDGTRAIRKSTKNIKGGRSAKEQQDAEEMAALVGGAIGARVPAVHRISDNEVFMEYEEDDDPAVSWLSGGEQSALAQTADGIRLGLLDHLIANPDRNSGNYLVSADRTRVTGIDHGAGWDDDENYNYNPGPFIAALGKENPLSPEDVVVVRERLTALLPEFERVGHPEWHTQMMETLEWVGQRAKGTERLIP